MQITKEQKGELGAVIKIAVQPEDYRPKVEKVIKNYQHSARIPGFRPGKIPVGMIKKMYGKSVLVEELNNLLSESLGRYIYENKMDMLGSPLPMKSEREHLYEDGQSFEFLYEVGLAPSVKVELSDNDKLPYYLIKVDDKMIDGEITDMRRRFGKHTYPETSGEHDILYGDFEELDETGAPKEGGNKTTTTLAIEMIKDQIEKKPFLGLKKEDVVVFNPMKTLNDEGEVEAMLKLQKNSQALNADYRFTVRTINALELAEINQEFFNKVYGEGVVNSEEELREKVKERIASYFEAESDHKLKRDLKPYLIEKLDIHLPDDFLKRMVKADQEKGKEISDHDFEHEYYHLAESLRWDLIKGYVAQENNITVNEEELMGLAREMVRQQLANYGIYEITPERLNEAAARYIKEEEDKKRLEKAIIEDKVFSVLKSQVKLIPEELSIEDFKNKLAEKTTHELEHHH